MANLSPRFIPDPSSENSHLSSNEYTDGEYEQEQEEEMDFTEVSNKRRASFSNSQSHSSGDETDKITQQRKKKTIATAIRKASLPIPVSNKFEALLNLVESPVGDEPTIAAPKKIKIPPIIIKSSLPFAKICKLIDDNSSTDYTLKPNGESLKLTLNSPEDYRKVTTALKASMVEYFTWALSPIKLYRFVLRGLPSTASEEAIKEEIITNYKLNVSAVKQLSGTDRLNGTKLFFPLFAVSIIPTAGSPAPDPSIISRLLHCVVTTEAPKSKSGPPQCFRCQKLGHRAEHCERAPRCVRCGGTHDAKSCTVEKPAPARCANCEGPHPASYRGCEYLVKARAKALNPHVNLTSDLYHRQRKAPHIRLEIPLSSAHTSRPVSSTFSYAAATANTISASSSPSPLAPAVVSPPLPASTPHIVTPAAIDWQEILLMIVNTVIECNIHPIVTSIAKMIPALISNPTILKIVPSIIAKFTSSV